MSSYLGLSDYHLSMTQIKGPLLTVITANPIFAVPIISANLTFNLSHKLRIIINGERSRFDEVIL